MRILVFGASITQGFYDTDGGWVARLRKYYDELLVNNPEHDQPTVFNLGISGDTSSRLLKRFENETNARKYPGEEFALIFCIGTNNSYVKGNGEQNSTPEVYGRDLEELVGKAKNFSNKIMFVGLPPCEETKTTPVSWKDIHYTNERILLFENVMREVCTTSNIPFVKTLEPIKERLDKGEDLYSDGLHPNNTGHQLVFELVRPELDRLLNT
ncbi:hypothetical protein KW803_03225 [Candidatus Saccharibacteria bacterium]|nr:hypothetical protein [Candidatus Saccharibacteria bacterium]